MSINQLHFIDGDSFTLIVIETLEKRRSELRFNTNLCKNNSIQWMTLFLFNDMHFILNTMKCFTCYFILLMLLKDKRAKLSMHKKGAIVIMLWPDHYPGTLHPPWSGRLFSSYVIVRLGGNLHLGPNNTATLLVFAHLLVLSQHKKMSPQCTEMMRILTLIVL